MQTQMTLSLYQNITALPNQTAIITKADPDSFNNFSQAIQRLDPNATLTNLQINVTSSTKWLNLTVAMGLTGVIERHGDISAVNMTWRAFSVPADLKTGNLTYNLVGKRYFRSVYAYYVNASKYVSRPNATITGVSFFTNQTQVVSPEQAIENAGNDTLLNFGSLNPALAQWIRAYNLANNTTTWRFYPPPVFADYIQIQQGNNTKVIGAQYNYAAEIITSGLARANGDALIIDVGSGLSEWVMLGIVVLALVAAVAIQLMFRTRKKLTKLGRK